MDRETAEDIKRHFDVVGESLRSDIRTVSEGFVSTNERLDRIESAMSEKFGELEVMIRLSFGELSQRISIAPAGSSCGLPALNLVKLG